MRGVLLLLFYHFEIKIVIKIANHKFFAVAHNIFRSVKTQIESRCSPSQREGKR